MVNGKVQKNARIRAPVKTVVNRNGPLRKRTQPYGRDMRFAALVRYGNRTEDATTQILQQMRDYPVRRTLRRYRGRFTQEGT